MDDIIILKHHLTDRTVQAGAFDELDPIGRYVWYPTQTSWVANKIRTSFEHFKSGINSLNPESSPHFVENYVEAMSVSITAMPVYDDEDDVDDFIFKKIQFETTDYQAASTSVDYPVPFVENPSLDQVLWPINQITEFPAAWDAWDEVMGKDFLFSIPEESLYEYYEKVLNIHIIYTDRFGNTYDHSGSTTFKYFGTESLFGDFNNDGGCNVLDLIELLNCVLSWEDSDPAGDCAIPIYDINGDGGLNILDIVTMANAILDNIANIDGCPYPP